MNKTLFISDLDGTLLNQEVMLSSFTVEHLNQILAQNIHVSIATARTAATVIKIMEPVSIREPVILMNGVCIYDLNTRNYIHTEEIPAASKQFLIDTLAHFELSGFLYTIENNQLSTYYERIGTHEAEAFMQERVHKYGKVFTKVDSLTDCLPKNIVYYSVSGSHTSLKAVYQMLSSDPGLHIEFYRDIYREHDWYLEICSKNASKYNAVQYIRKNYGFNPIIGFGDNLNDLPLFQACDTCYAVANARTEVKEQANGIIETNQEDGVIRQMLRMLSL